jgi:nucleotide-binding universal stress UspA family protein
MRILLATDGAPGSEGALNVSARLAEERGAEVEVLHVLQPMVVQTPDSTAMLWLPPSSVDDRQRTAAASAELARLLAAAGGPAERWPAHVEIGPVAPTIVEQAERLGVSMIVMGAGRHDALDRWLGTETAVRTMQVAHVPVLAVPHSATGEYRNVVAAVDLSEFSRDALAAALRLCSDGATLHLAHAAPSQPHDLLGAGSPSWGEDESVQARARILAWAAEVPGGAGRRFEVHLLEGTVHQEILRLAEKLGAELIAAGSHGHGFWGRLLLGSVSTRLIRGAQCSVLIAPPREPAGRPPRPGGVSMEGEGG